MVMGISNFKYCKLNWNFDVSEGRGGSDQNLLCWEGKSVNILLHVSRHVFEEHWSKLSNKEA